ncbi:MAG: hypothetical protein ABEJ58_06610 [Halodesulfurarchaeum sp.]
MVGSDHDPTDHGFATNGVHIGQSLNVATDTDLGTPPRYRAASYVLSETNHAPKSVAVEEGKRHP